jgi:hypothetical protein
MTRVTKQLHGTRLLQLVRKSEDQVAHLSAAPRNWPQLQPDSQSEAMVVETRTGVGREADTTKR